MVNIIATKKKDIPGIVHGVRFVNAVSKSPRGTLYFTLNFSAN